jgi:Tol biopolymer transport system component
MGDSVARLGKQLGNYRLMSLLGKGGFAEVYLGEHIHLGTQAAVKVLHTQLASEEVEGFKYEARTIARLAHHNIVRVLDFGVEQGAPFLVMDYAPNGTLRQRYPRGARLSPSEVVGYVKQVADALQCAHEQRLIHRDVKPENMLLGRANEVLLSDFGIALAAQSSQYQSKQNVAGTIAYMAPEQIQAHPRPASDQYALGVVVYEWLGGARPFSGSFTEIAVKHCVTPPPPLRQYVPALPASIEEVVMVALNKDPHQRFATVRDFATALERASLQQYYPSTRLQAGGMPLPSPTGSAMSMVSPATTGAYPYGQGQPSAYLGQHALPPAPPPSYSYPYVQPFPPATPAHMSTSLPLPSRPPRNASRRALLAGAVGLAAGGAIATWFAFASGLASPHPASVSQLVSGGTHNLFFSSTPTITPVLTYTGQPDYIWSVDWSPDGRYIASGSNDGTAQVWDAGTGARLLSYRSHLQPAMSNDICWSVSWSPSGKKLLVGFLDGRVEMLDLVSRTMQGVYQGQTPVRSVAWSPGERYLAAGRSDDTVRVYDVATGQSLLTYTGHNDFVLSVAWSPDGKRIASSASDGLVKVWRASDGQTLLNYTNHHSDVHAVSWSHDGTRIASAASDGTAQVWDAVTGRTLLVYTKHVGGIVDAIGWSHNDASIATGGNDATTHIWEATTGKIISTYPTISIFSLSWSPDDTRLVTSGIHKNAQVWRVK